MKMTNKHRKSIMKENKEEKRGAGRPFAEPKRQVRIRWSLKVAAWIEKNRNKIVDMTKEENK